MEQTPASADISQRLSKESAGAAEVASASALAAAIARIIRTGQREARNAHAVLDMVATECEKFL
jgi:hypothetical protein